MWKAESLNTFIKVILITYVVFYFTIDSGLGITLEERWKAYKENFNKTYHAGLENLRKKIWEANIKFIERHNKKANKGRYSFKLNSNPFSDLSRPQYLNQMTDLIPIVRKKVGDLTLGSSHAEMPKEVDWRKEGFKTPPWNQRSCGSCYAFAITAGIQGQFMKETGNLQMLSAQQILDCSSSFGNKGCLGGTFRNSMNYVENFGLMEAKEYSYIAKTSRCQYQPEKVVANITSWNAVPARDERALQVAVATMGPVAAAVDASPKTFQLYSSGIYDDPLCSSIKMNHAVLVVGYTEKAWILKNWWGKHWGEEGYMLLARNKNRCGIANYAVYAIL